MFILGCKYPIKVENHSKSNITLLVCGSANGTLLSPFIIYKGEHIYTPWTENGPKGAPFCKESCAFGSHYAHSKSGWIDSVSFTDWFRLLFLPHAKHLEDRKVLLGDNLSSYFTPEVIELCQKNDISFAFFVPNSTHISQLLDVAFFRAMEEAWRKTVAKFKREFSRNKGIPKSIFAKLVNETFQTMDIVTINNKEVRGRISANLKSGFETCGIVPHNPQKLLKKLMPQVPEEQNNMLETTLVTFLSTQRFRNKELPTRRARKRDIISDRAIEPEVPGTSDNNEVLSTITNNVPNINNSNR